MTNTNRLRITVTTTAYDGDAPFPEAEHYPDYVAACLAEAYPGAEIDVSEGQRTGVSVDGSADESADLQHEIATLVKVDLWDAFCTDGYKAYTEQA